MSRYFRLSIRTFLIMVFLLCVGLALARRSSDCRDVAINQLQEVGSVEFEDDENSTSGVIRWISGTHHCRSVKEIRVTSRRDASGAILEPNLPRGFLQCLRYVCETSSLALSGRDVTDDDLEYVGGLDRLEFLSLSCTAVTDRGVSYLGTLRRLKTLHINSTRIGTKSVRIVGSLPVLEELDLSTTFIDAESVEILRTMKGLKRLDISGTRLEPAHIAALRSDLPNCQIEYFVPFSVTPTKSE
jgi:hypothetical protein